MTDEETKFLTMVKNLYEILREYQYYDSVNYKNINPSMWNEIKSDVRDHLSYMFNFLKENPDAFA